MEYTATITLTSPHPLTEDDLFDLAGLGGAASGEPGGHTASATYTVEGVDLGDAAREAVDLAYKAIPDATVDGLELVTFDEQDRRLAVPAFPELAGIAEVADILGVSRQRASALQTRQGFPAPVAVLRSGPVWRSGDLTTFADEWTRQPGRPRTRELTS